MWGKIDESALCDILEFELVFKFTRGATGYYIRNQKGSW
jgi:hypothetical protein